MQCPNCGSDQQTTGSCTDCGAVLSAQGASQTSLRPPEAPKKRGCRGCLMGCLVAFLGLALITLVAAGWFFNWPERWGIIASPAEKLFEASPNPWAAEAIEAELSEQGVSLEGTTIYVMPMEDSVGQLAYILVEDARGAHWSPADSTYRSPAEGLLMLTAGTQAVTDHEIVRVAVDHRDTENVQVAVMTAEISALRDYLAGAMSQQELFDQMDGYADLVGSIGGMSE